MSESDNPSPPGPARENPHLLPRRAVLKYGGALAVVGLPALGGCAADANAPSGTEGPTEETVGAAVLDDALWVDVVRKEDLVVLRLAFVNLEVRDKKVTAPPPGLELAGDLYLTRQTAGQAAYIVVVFQPQHITEKTFDETGGEKPLVGSTAAIPHRMANDSRLAFRVPATVTAIPYELDKILAAITSYSLNVAAGASPQEPEPSRMPLVPIFGSQAPTPMPTSGAKTTTGIRAMRARRATGAFTAANPEAVVSAETTLPPGPIVPLLPTQPGELHTAIELPFRMQISPNSYAKWQHAAQPVKSTVSNRVELWHTRLTTPASWQKTIRALWTRDANFDPSDWQVNQPDASPIYTTLEAQDRCDIVHLTTNHTLKDKSEQPRARAVNVDSLMLTALGGWLDVHGRWKDPSLTTTTGPSLIEWDHEATLGRDHKVRVVRIGYLFPYGHTAVWIRVCERKFHKKGAEDWTDTAYVWSREFIIVKEPLKTYDTLSPSLVRGFPFKSVRFKTIVTPLIAPKATAPVGQFSAWPYINGKPFHFEVEAFDHDGNAHDFTTACIWMDAGEPGVQPLTDAWTSQMSDGGPARRVAMRGQRVAFAEGEAVDDTRYSVDAMFHTAKPLPNSSGAPFVPQLETAELDVDTIRGLTGASGTTPFEYHPGYLQNGFVTNNAGGVFLRVKGDTAKLDFNKQSDKSGGFVSPSLGVSALSRKQGIVSGNPDKAAAADFNPSEFFGDIPAKLFGVVNLFDIIKAVAGNEFFEQAPKFITQALQGAEMVFQLVQSGEELGNKLKTQIQSIESFIADLPDDPKLVPEKDRVAPNGLTDANKALFLRVWSKAASLGLSKNEIVQKVGALATNVQAVIDAGAALGTALEQVASIDESTDLHALADTIIGALKSAWNALGALASEFGINALPVDDGLRLQLTKTSENFRKLFADEGAVSAFFDGVMAFLTATDAIANLHIKLEWAPEIQPWPNTQYGIFWPNDRRGFRLGVEARAKASGGQPAGAEVFASLVDFELRLLGQDPFIKLVFDRLAFKAGTAGKPEIDCVFRGLHFAGPLEFIETLRDFIPLDGFSDPPNVVVDMSGLHANFTLPLPNIALGMFSLENLSFSAGFEIPFIGESLTVSFSFCSRESPFVLTVCMLGGGGFVGIHIAPDGLRKLEISLEATACLSIDFGVASGSVGIAVGIYFAIENGDECTLTGYLRIRGEVEVLGGIISASIELYMELTWQSETGKVIGYASIEIEVTVVVFSGTVTIECERKFRGGNDDPTFRELMAYDPVTSFKPWEEYCEAFAA